MEFKHAQLGNGLHIVAEIRDTARSMALGFFTRTGSRDETAEVSGVSHFLEHMIFKGTAKRGALDINIEFDRMGAKYNAFTSEENTVFYAAVLPEYQDRVLALWSDLMRPALRDDVFTLEKGVILEEIAMYKDTPHFDVFDRARKAHFGEHPCGNSVLGTDQSIRELTANQMRDYYRSRYSPDNMVLVAVGQVDWPHLLEQADALCGDWAPRRPRRACADIAGSGAVQAIPSDRIQREHLCFVSQAPAEQSDQRFAAAVLANIMGDYTGSRLYWALVDNALADNAEMEYDSQDGTGAFYTYVSCDPQRSEDVIAVVKECYQAIIRDGVTEAELQASRNKIASHTTLHGELPMGRLVPLGFGWVYRKDYVSLADEIRMIQNVTREDIMALLERYPFSPCSIVGLGPRDSFSL